MTDEPKMSFRKLLISILTFFTLCVPLSARQPEQKDSLVRLMSAQSAQLMKDDFGQTIRKVIGPAVSCTTILI
jgi:flagellar motor switch protein FliG